MRKKNLLKLQVCFVLLTDETKRRKIFFTAIKSQTYEAIVLSCRDLKKYNTTALFKNSYTGSLKSMDTTKYFQNGLAELLEIWHTVRSI
jgi:hypothetical protein